MGENTSAIFGFTSTISRIIKENNPDFLIVAKDLPQPTFRHQIFPEYKSQRKPMPDELRQQFPLIEQFLDLYCIPSFSKEGYEADDVMASIALKMQDENIHTFLVTKDKDLMQVVNKNIFLFEPGSQKQPEKKIGETEVKEKFCVKPSQMHDFLALMGDASDFIPGIPKVGPKTAQNLLQEYQSLDQIYQNIDSIKPASLQNRLKEHKQQAYLSHQLVELKTDLSFDLNLASMKTPQIHSNELLDFLERWECHSVLNRLKKTTPQKIQIKIQTNDYQSITKKEQVTDFIKALHQSSMTAFYLETHQLDHFTQTPIGIAITISNEQSFYLSSKILHEFSLSLELQKHLNDSKKTCIFYDLKSNLPFLQQLGITISNQHNFVDTMLAAYVLQSGATQFTLFQLAQEYLNTSITPLSKIIGEKKTNQILFADVASEQQAKYLTESSITNLKLWNVLKEGLQKKNLLKLFYEQEIPVLFVLSQMELSGITLDVKSIQPFSKSIKKKLHVLETKIHQEAQESFNIRSTQQLANILYNKLNLTTKKKTKTGFSTDISALQKMKDQHPIIPLIIEVSRISKITQYLY